MLGIHGVIGLIAKIAGGLADTRGRDLVLMQCGESVRSCTQLNGVHLRKCEVEGYHSWAGILTVVMNKSLTVI